MRIRTLIALAALVVACAASYWFSRPHRQASAPSMTLAQPRPGSKAPRADATPPPTANVPTLAAASEPAPQSREPLSVAPSASRPATSVTPSAPSSSFAVPTDEEIALAEENGRATARMLAAHASLRNERVADPDSAENHRILQTMITKALAQRAPLPPQSRNN